MLRSPAIGGSVTLIAEHRPMLAASPHRYSAYGLAVASWLPLPELFPADDAAPAPGTPIPEVAIRLEPLAEIGEDEDPPGARRIGPFLWVDADRFWFRVPGIARFRVTAGREIVVDPDPAADDEGIRTFLLGTALGVLLTQRGKLMLHGNAVRVGDGCVICAGRSGAGKSTLAAGFHRRGYALLSDDLVMVDEHGTVTPGIPRVKLWADMTRAMAIDTGPLQRVRPTLEKFSYPVHDGFARAAVPVRALYALVPSGDDRVSIEPLTGFAKVKEVRANTYRPRLIEAVAMRGRHMALCTRLAAAIPMAGLKRPAQGFSVDALIDAILADLEEPA